MKPMKGICRCPSPARDTADPDRLLRCAACEGPTPRSQPPTIAAVKEQAERALDMVQAVYDGYRKLHPTLWEPTSSRGLEGGACPPRWSDPTLAAADNAACKQKREWAAVLWDHLARAVDLLEAADSAVGRIAEVDNRHREDTRASAWDKPLTADTPDDQVPLRHKDAVRRLRQREGRA